MLRPEGLWSDPLYLETAGLILAFLIVLSLFIFFFRRKSAHLMAGWASIKSWFFAAPFFLVLLALPAPWPLVFLTLVGLSSAKTFFQMVGMYHRTLFVVLTYVFIALLGYMVATEQTALYDLMPMIFLATASFVPLVTNNPERMIQYMALSLMAFIFFGWSFMHMARFLVMEKGVYIVLYLYILTEISENISLAATRVFGRIKPFNKITHRVTVEGILVSVVMSLLLAWGMRHLLPDGSERFWIAAGLVAAVFGRLGDLILCVIRRDLKLKDTGVFIIGRGDILSRVDKLIFVGPLYYYILLALQKAV